MKLTYWAARRLDDSACYNIRQRTRKAARAERAELVAGGCRYAAVAKVVIEYRDAFDLAYQLLGEGGAESGLPHGDVEDDDE
jgi:hypothetical protein